MRKYREESGDLKTIRHTVQVTSFGGSGTTALCEYLTAAGIDLPRTPGLFPFKHQRVPPDPDKVPAGFRVVYLYGDPRNALLSLFSRELQEATYRWLYFRPPPEDVRQRLSSLEAFLEAGTDEFKFEDHLDRWLTREPSGYEVLFLNFESLPDSWPALRTFVELRPDYPCLELKPRKSDWQALPDTQRERLDRMYGGLARRIEALPPVQIL
jgi:hypothetical protein